MPTTPTPLVRELHDEHAAALFAFCLQLTGQDRARAEDVTQETLLRAWQHADVLDGRQGSVRSWLYTVARRIVIDEWRTQRSRQEVVVGEVPDLSPVADRSDELLQSWVVSEALTRLSADHRAVLLECYYRGASVAEAARRLDVPEGTVKSRTHYALRALRLILEEMGAAGP